MTWHPWIQLLLGGWVMASVLGCSPVSPASPGNTEITPPPDRPAAQATDVHPLATPAAASRPQAAGARLWTAVPITQTLPDDTQEKPTMRGALVSTPFDPALQQLVLQAQQDLARRLSVPVEQIQLEKVQSVTWPDKGLGCPQPGMIYTQVQVDGLLIRFRAGGRVYEYHSGGNRAPFLCEQAAGKPGDETLAPPPGLGTQ